MGLQVTMRGRERRPGDPDILSGPPKTSFEHYGLGHWGLRVPQRGPQ